MKFKMLPKTMQASGLAKFKAGDPPPTEIGLKDNEDGNYTLLGTTSGGNTKDISDVAHLQGPVSADPSHVTASGPTSVGACSGQVKAVGPVTTDPVSVTDQVVWNDGSMGPFGYELKVSVAAGPVSGVAVKIDSITPH